MRSFRVMMAVVAAGAVALGTGVAAFAGDPPARSDAGTVPAPTGMLALTGTVDNPPHLHNVAVVRYDPRTGQRTGAYLTPFEPTEVAVSRERYAVSPNRRYVVDDSHTVSLAAFDGERYVRTAQVRPEDLAPAEDEAQDLIDPVFRGGRLYFTKAVGPVDPDTQTRTHEVGWYSIDPAAPGTVRTEKRGADTDPTQRDVALPTGLSDAYGHPLTAHVTMTDRRLRHAFVHADGYLSGEYRCGARLDAGHLLCVYYEERYDWEDWPTGMASGRIAVLSLSDDGTGAVLTKLVDRLSHDPVADPDLNGESSSDIYLSPNRKRMLIGTENGWFLGPTDGSSAPRFLRENLDTPALSSSDTMMIGWSRHGGGAFRW